MYFAWTGLESIELLTVQCEIIPTSVGGASSRKEETSGQGFTTHSFMGLAEIMAHGGFNIKYMIRDGEERPEVLNQFGGAVLGIM